MKTASIERPRAESLISDIAELCKARLSFMVLITTLVGFLLAWRGPMNFGLLAATLLGTALCAAGASVLNQWWERDSDALMKRTRERPLPGRRIHPSDALLFGLLVSSLGVAILALFTHPRAAFLAFATIAIYVVVYTPLKKMTSLNTLVGAVPGALPPLIGWVAARGSYSLEGCLLFAVLWFWQMPHFLAIAWLYKDDYAQAGFVMLPASDPDGCTTGRQAVLYALCLVLVTLVPVLAGFNAVWFFFAALVVGAGFVWFAVAFLIGRDQRSARRLFLASIVYLPVLLGLMLASRS